MTSPDYEVFRARGINPEFTLCLLRSPFYRMYIDWGTTESIRDRFYLSDLCNMRIPEVSISEQARIAEMARRDDEETADLLRRLAAQKQVIVERIHSLIDSAEATEHPDVNNRFLALANQWRRETGPYSSISRKVSYPAYQKIIAMGEPALPLILREMRERPAHWFTAWCAIAKSPPPNEGADIGRATAAWLKWGQERGYID